MFKPDKFFLNWKNEKCYGKTQKTIDCSKCNLQQSIKASWAKLQLRIWSLKTATKTTDLRHNVSNWKFLLWDMCRKRIIFYSNWLFRITNERMTKGSRLKRQLWNFIRRSLYVINSVVDSVKLPFYTHLPQFL